jgi:hypothetical protein
VSPHAVESFVTGPRIDERAIDREVLVRQPPVRIRVTQDGIEKTRSRYRRRASESRFERTCYDLASRS